MSKHLTRSLLILTALAAGLLTATAGEDKKTCPSTSANKTDCKLLKGVAHLRDNDVRFARKGGGVVFVDPTAGPTDAPWSRPAW